MENLHRFDFFLNEKKSYKDLFPDEIAMVSGIIEILKQVKDLKNREEMIETQIRNFKKEKISFDYSEFKKLANK
jgi:lipid A disaccharide synthetase